MKGITILFTQLEGFESYGNASTLQIKEAEEELSLHFSDEYNKYLIAFGCAEYNGHELTGICKFPRLDVVKVTIEERKLNDNIPNNLYVIEQAHIDGIVIWQDENGYIYQTVGNSEPIKIFDSLIDYLKE